MVIIPGMLSWPDFRNWRKEAGWTQEDLAFLTGFSISTISAVENLKRPPSRSFLAKAAFQCNKIDELKRYW